MKAVLMISLLWQGALSAMLQIRGKEHAALGFKTGNEEFAIYSDFSKSKLCLSHGLSSTASHNSG